MFTQVVYSRQADKELMGLPKNIAHRIVKKVKFYSEQKDPLQFAKSLQNAQFGSYRFRIGDYRVLFDVNKNNQITILLILSVKHRREVYR